MIPDTRNETETPDATEPVLFSVPAAGRKLGISPKKAWQLVWSGALQSRRLDRRRLVHIDEIRRFAADLPVAEPEMEKAV